MPGFVPGPVVLRGLLEVLKDGANGSAGHIPLLKLTSPVPKLQVTSVRSDKAHSNTLYYCPDMIKIK